MSEKQSTVQLILGLAYACAGIGVIYRTPQVVAQLLAQYDYFSTVKYFVYFVCYLLAVLLIIGGGRKIYAYFKKGE